MNDEQTELMMDIQKPLNRKYDWEINRDKAVNAEIAYFLEQFQNIIRMHMNNMYKQGHIDCEKLYEARAKAFLVNNENK